MDAWPGFSSEPSRLWCSRWATTSPPGRTEWRPLVRSATGYFLCRSRIQARRSLDNAEKEPALSLSLLGGWRLSCHHRPLCCLDKVVCCDNKWVKIWSGQSRQLCPLCLDQSKGCKLIFVYCVDEPLRKKNRFWVELQSNWVLDNLLSTKVCTEFSALIL